MGFFVELLEHVTTLRGQSLVSKTDDDPLLPPHVYVQNVPVCTGTTPTCVYTGCTHGFFFSVSLHTPHHNNDNDNDTQQRQRQRHTTTHNLQLHSTQDGKTHQVQTQQGLTNSSFFIFSVVLHGRFLSW